METRTRTDRTSSISNPALISFFENVLRLELDLDPFGDIADLGSGRGMPLAKFLRKEFRWAGIHAVDLQFSQLLEEKDGILRSNSLKGKYDLIVASNVLNVQRNASELSALVEEVSRSLRLGGFFVANYPNDPRYMEMTSAEMEDLLQTNFTKVFSWGKVGNRWKSYPEGSPQKRAPVFFAVKL